jgi:hypothetical protein
MWPAFVNLEILEGVPAPPVLPPHKTLFVSQLPDAVVPRPPLPTVPPLPLPPAESDDVVDLPELPPQELISAAISVAAQNNRTRSSNLWDAMAYLLSAPTKMAVCNRKNEQPGYIRRKAAQDLQLLPLSCKARIRGNTLKRNDRIHGNAPAGVITFSAECDSRAACYGSTIRTRGNPAAAGMECWRGTRA